MSLITLKCITYVAVSGDQISRFNHWAVFQMLWNQLENSRFRFIEALWFIKFFCLLLIFQESMAWWCKNFVTKNVVFQQQKAKQCQIHKILGILPTTQTWPFKQHCQSRCQCGQIYELGNRQNSCYVGSLAFCIRKTAFCFRSSSNTFSENQT